MRWLLCLCVSAALCMESTRLVVTFRNESEADRVQSLPSADIIKRNGRRIVVDLGRPVYLQEDVQYIQSLVDPADVLVELDHLTTPSQVQFVYSDVLDVTAADNSSDFLAGGFWNLLDSEPYGIHVQSVWRLTNSTPDVVVALLDSGLAAPAFSAFLHVGDGYDFISDPSLAMDGDGRDADFTDPGDSGPACPVPSWHGTKVASVLAADHAVFPGVAPNCTLLPVRVLGMCRTGYASDVADAIVWASGGAVEGVPINPTPGRVVSMSFTGDADCPSYLQAAIDEAVQLGALPVAAAGNDGVNTTDFFPANCRGVLAVAASTRQGGLAAYSNYGPDIALAAPGGDEANPIATLTVLDGGIETEFAMGTSFAVPQVAGVAALAMARGWTIAKLSYALIHTANQFQTACDFCGSGILNAPLIKNNSQYQTTVYNHEYIGNIHNYSNDPNLTVIGQFALANPQSCSAGYSPNHNYAINSGANYQMDCSHMSGSPVYGAFVCLLQFYTTVPYGAGTTDDIGQAIYGTGVSCCDISGNLIGTSLITGSWSTSTSNNQITFYGANTFTVPYTVYWTWTFAGVSMLSCSNPPCYFGDDSSGEVYASTCPAGSVVTGVFGWHGSYLDEMSPECNNLCVVCAPGTYGTTGASCASCPSGAYSASSGLTTCATCSAGYYAGTGATLCSACSAGTYSASGASLCSACSAGTYSATTGASSSGTCSACSAGKFSASTGASSSGTCSACSIGYFANSAGQSACLACPAGSYVATTAQTLCATCGAGYYASSTGQSVCAACAAGYYSSSTAQSVCVTCAAGYYASSTAQSVCATCAAGHYAPSTAQSICATCVAGYYASSTAQSACANCAAGNYASSTAQSVCATCATGYYTSSTAQSVCATCATGYYASSTVQSACTTCVAGAYSSAPSQSACTACTAGAYSATTGLSVCLLCPTGTYGVNGGLSSCTQCLTGTYGANTGQTSIASCLTCPTGTFQPYTGQSSCLGNPVSAGQYCPHYQGAVTNCGVENGNGNIGDSYLACGGGTCCAWSLNAGCSFAGTFLYASMRRLLQTQTGSYWNCNAGCNSAAVSCTAGNYCPAGSVTQIPCSAGQYSAVGASACTSCQAGTYSAASGQSSCTACTSGNYAATPGLSACQPCATCNAGFYNKFCTTTTPGNCSTQCTN